tara:strand:+ start:2803 stop:4536 length:1734 start_codon:yes stop_codon:yes gene_type:complete
MFKQFRDVLKTIGRKNQISAIYIIIVSLIIISLELISFALIIPAVSIPLKSDLLLNSSIFNFLNEITSFDLISFLTLKNVLMLLISIILLKLIFLLYFQYKLKQIMWQVKVDINSLIYKYFTLISIQEILEAGFANVRRLINSDSTLFVTQGFYNYILLCKHFILSIGLFFFLLQINFEATLTIFGILGVFVFIYNLLLKKRAVSLAIKFREFQEYKYKNVDHTILGIREVKLFNNEDLVVESFKKNENKLAKIDIETSIFNLLPKLLLEFLIVLGISFFVFFLTYKGYDLVGILPKLALFFLVFLRALPLLIGINNSLLAIKYSKVQIDEVIKQLASLKNKKYLIPSSNGKPFDLSKNKKLVIKDLTFNYNNGKNIFSNLNIEFKENNIIGIQGDNGTGKSTLVDLIAGFLEPQSGKVIFNDQDIHENIKDWRKLIGYVSQSQFLTADTIKNNIIFSKNQKVDENKLENAITKSGVKNFISDIPNGIESHIGDLGLKLSGGQKQRISIARVLYKSPEIIILDEPTSAQDNKIEDYFLKVIKELKLNKIIILISHSQNIHAICDENYRVKDKTLIKI